MKPNLFQAIDRIGDRLAARLDWETMSGLPWGELKPYLVPAPGKLAREVLDPGDPGQRLAVWPRENALTILESQEIPAHREPLEVEQDACILHRLNVAKLAADLAGPIGFIPLPAKNGRDFHRIGMVQVPNRAAVDVFLLVPQTPGSAKLAAQRLVADRGGKETMVLLPSARWSEILPAFPGNFEIRIVGRAIHGQEEDYLISIASICAKPRCAPASRPAKALQVRQEDRWQHLVVTVDPANATAEFRIGNRSLSVSLLGRGRKPNRMARVLGSILRQKPNRWTITGLSNSEKSSLRQEFIRFQHDLLKRVPVPDGPPFRYDPQERAHFPRFTLRLSVNSDRIDH